MSIPKAIVRPALPSDLRTVADIFTHYVRHTVATFEETPPTVADWERRLDDLTGRKLPFLVAESSGMVAGFACAAQWRPKPAYRYTVEDTVYLAPDATGRGLGAALLSALVAGSTRAGMRQMIAVIADTGSDASLALHRRFGFTEAGHLVGVGYKHGRWIGTFLLQRDLTPGQPE
ncbi:GNAT family N-acetyltransferase [Streptomyces sp. TRM68367]|uniref:GNAT family N-acetyltransferase n=1 Tax=Streptomyces sp. TRM68367 TaxID=2758415 RepID=UPI00165BF9C4|nr:GNAT family N-acetyltransferase [Streptomyces sp. TRM68367]MBC9726497.1 N-acetyltransferase family protein [Streptomyces sp. TRM68367]